SPRARTNVCTTPASAAARSSWRAATCSAVRANRSGIDDHPAGAQWTGVDPAREVVGNRAGRTRMLLGEDAMADDRDRRPDGDLTFELDRERVHRDGPDHASGLSADTDGRSRQVAAKPVGVPDGDDPDARVGL